MTELMTNLQPGIATVSVLFVVSALVLCVALWSTARSRRQTRQLRKEVTQLRSDIRALTTSSVGVGGRVLELERRLRRLAQRQEEFDIYESANQPYEHAIAMARKGADVKEIEDICGVSRNEAELIQMMHRLEKAS
jgi:Flp pilus assembly protein TadB